MGGRTARNLFVNIISGREVPGNGRVPREAGHGGGSTEVTTVSNPVAPPAPEVSPAPHRSRAAQYRPDIAGLLWVLGAAAAMMAPALAHGVYLGPIGWVSGYGLSNQSGGATSIPHAFDQVSEIIPWTNLAWTQVHHGQLPLWNPYSGLGMPLAFNWQSAAFGVPTLLGYLVPVRLAYTVQVLVTLVIAGSGMYVLGRVLRLGVLGCVMAAVVYELSGPFVGWLGWPIAAVTAWAGWLFAAALLVVRGRRRTRAVAFLAVAVACAIYAGQPDMLTVLASALLVFLAVLLATRAPWGGGSGPILRPVMDLTVATAVGAALSAPLLLPGLQLVSGSLRSGKGLSNALPAQNILLALFQGFDGLPVGGSRWFGPSSYTPSTTYVGVIAVVLAVVAVLIAFKFGSRRPIVVAFAMTGIVMGLIVYLPVAESLLDGLPFVGNVLWRRATVPMTFAIAALAGVGADMIVRSYAQRAVPRWIGTAFATAGVVLALLWLFARGTLPAAEASMRDRSFLWPAAATVVGLAAAGILISVARHGRAEGSRADLPAQKRARWWVVLVLLGCETGFLVTAGAPLPASSPSYLAPTRAEVVLARAVGSSVVGFGTNTCFTQQLGIVPDVNVAFGVREFALYDPLVPRSYNMSWETSTGQPAYPATSLGVPYSFFCPAVTTAALARRYGVGFVLEPARAIGPKGAVFVMTVGAEKLYRIPGASAATLTVAPAGNALPGQDARGTPVPVTHPDPATWRLDTTGVLPQVLRLHLTDVPGWTGTIDGRPLVLQRYLGMMLQARVPPGRHVIVLRYRPRAFTIGLVLGAASAVGLGAALMGGATRRRRRCPARPLGPLSWEFCP